LASSELAAQGGNAHEKRGIVSMLVVFAGSDLSTGHATFMRIGLARGSVDATALARCWAMSWAGNLAGSALLALIFWVGGGGRILKDGALATAPAE
jgi:nitrite transporter NirC